MAYITGTANSLGDLVTALRNACTANGWTLAGNVLYKDGCYVDVQAHAKGSFPDFGLIEIKAGIGIDGSNLLTGMPAQYKSNWDAGGCIGPLGNGFSTSQYTDWDWPVTFHIHVHADPDEVFLLVSYGAGQYWQSLSFGRSPAPGCPGTGNWCYGSVPRRSRNSDPPAAGGRLLGEDRVVVKPDGTGLSTYNGGVIPGAIPFWGYLMDQSGSIPNPGQFHGTWMNDGVTAGWSHPRYYWNSSGNPGSAMNVVCASRASQPLPTFSPNSWNSEAHLIRLQIMSPRLDWKSSIVGEIKHARFCRNDFLAPGAVITLGTDEWKVYPAYRRDVENRNGGGSAGANHSGTCALAVRYDGP